MIEMCNATMEALGLETFSALVKSRSATRHFLSDPVPPALLEHLLEAARWAPSGFNLQPTHFVVVTDPETRQQLYEPCMKQRQVLEAGATVVFTGDRLVVENQFEQILQQDRTNGAINAGYEQLLRKGVPLLFNRGPLGIGRIWKAIAETVVRRFRYIPSFQAVRMKYWLAKQVSLAAMVFMLAAEAAGLATCPMEGFDERGVRRVLGIPASHVVVLAVAVGYAEKPVHKRTRLPLEGRVHQNQW